jgi:hypothetical protein
MRFPLLSLLLLFVAPVALSNNSTIELRVDVTPDITFMSDLNVDVYPPPSSPIMIEEGEDTIWVFSHEGSEVCLEKSGAEELVESDPFSLKIQREKRGKDGSIEIHSLTKPFYCPEFMSKHNAYFYEKHFTHWVVISAVIKSALDLQYKGIGDQDYSDFAKIHVYKIFPAFIIGGRFIDILNYLETNLPTPTFIKSPVFIKIITP